MEQDCEIFTPVPQFTCPAAFDFLNSLSLFGFLPNFPHCSICFFFFLVFCKGGLAIKALDKHCNEKRFLINKVSF